MPNWRVFESRALECINIFLSVNTMHFHSHFGKTPVGCIVGLHSDMVLPFTVVLVQTFWCDVVWVFKVVLPGGSFHWSFLPCSCGNSFRTWLSYIPKAQMRKDKESKASDLKKMWKKLKRSALMPFKSLMTHSFDWLNLAAFVVFWVYLWKPTIVGFVILCIQ